MISNEEKDVEGIVFQSASQENTEKKLLTPTLILPLQGGGEIGNNFQPPLPPQGGGDLRKNTNLLSQGVGEMGNNLQYLLPSPLGGRGSG